MTDITQWDAWQRGLAAAIEAMADTNPAGKQPDVRAAHSTPAAPEPIVYCPAPNCGLTVAPGNGRCWIHQPVERVTTEGLLK